MSPTPAERLARRMATNACMKAGFGDHAPLLLPYARAIIEAEKALASVESMAVAWEPLTPGDIGEVKSALSSLRKVIEGGGE